MSFWTVEKLKSWKNIGLERCSPVANAFIRMSLFRISLLFPIIHTLLFVHLCIEPHMGLENIKTEMKAGKFYYYIRSYKYHGYLIFIVYNL